MTDLQLCKTALHAMTHAYNPYSNFSVGAALLCKNGSVYEGCNIENASYTPTVCAERVAFFKAVSEGNLEFKKIAIAGGSKGESLKICPPCGVCRQVMRKKKKKDFEILLVTDTGFEKYTLEQLLPLSFNLLEVKSDAHD